MTKQLCTYIPLLLFAALLASVPASADALILDRIFGDIFDPKEHFERIKEGPFGLFGSGSSKPRKVYNTYNENYSIHSSPNSQIISRSNVMGTTQNYIAHSTVGGGGVLNVRTDGPAHMLTCTSWIIKGWVDTASTSVHYYFEWGPSESFGHRSEVKTISGSGPVTFTVSRLQDNTTYYYRTVAYNGSTTRVGNTERFVASCNVTPAHTPPSSPQNFSPAQPPISNTVIVAPTFSPYFSPAFSPAFSPSNSNTNTPSYTSNTPSYTSTYAPYTSTYAPSYSDNSRYTYDYNYDYYNNQTSNQQSSYEWRPWTYSNYSSSYNAPEYTSSYYAPENRNYQYSNYQYSPYWNNQNQHQNSGYFYPW